MLELWVIFLFFFENEMSVCQPITEAISNINHELGYVCNNAIINGIINMNMNFRSIKKLLINRIAPWALLGRGTSSSSCVCHTLYFQLS